MAWESADYDVLTDLAKQLKRIANKLEEIQVYDGAICTFQQNKK
ncbi:unnamed protein product [marine sediment metagenome]|uniref:Uncharacterized protein n=1 Tax=marine sediment metagenome TaxID=412755 RepID=X1BYZ1_9ZZZZ